MKYEVVLRVFLCLELYVAWKHFKCFHKCVRSSSLEIGQISAWERTKMMIF